jgi:DNA-binding response OmpR family regulator
VELVAAGLRVDPSERRCWRGDSEIELTAREFSVLEYLVTNAGTVVSKQDILGHVWDYEFDGDPNIVEVYVRHLRKKIDLPFDTDSIQTVRGAGYRLAASPP